MIKIIEKDSYIKGPEKFPIDPNRWGYLQISLQHFFQESASSCQISKTNTNIKPEHECLLRHGVENSKTQSFIACISDVLFHGKSQILSISEMKQLIINSINIDQYITFQNGNNFKHFLDDTDAADINVEKYNKSRLYQKIYNDVRDEKSDIYFKKVCISYENFIKYLLDDSQIIDYTYLWDIICSPNPNLFPSGINLIILDIPNNDITNNIEIICPSNHYSNEFYSSIKYTLFLVKMENYYEPIYLYKNKERKVKITKLFSEHDPNLTLNMRTIFQKIIKPILKNNCGPLPSMPNVYKFIEPILLQSLIKLLEKYKYTILKQIFNYQNKVIGLLVTDKENKSGYVPCYPSSMLKEYPYIFMDDPELYFNYTSTLLFLINLSKESKKKIPVLPIVKIVEDEFIVGFLTETNQFIQLSEPFPLKDAIDEIPVSENSNYILDKNVGPMQQADSYISGENGLDQDRIHYIKNIKLETNFYNVFRNTIRILLNNPANIKVRKQLEEELNSEFILYSEKLNMTNMHLKQLAQNSIIFTEKFDASLVNDITTCLTNTPDNCNSKNPVCMLSESNQCQLVIPKYNLLTPTINNELFIFFNLH